MLWRSCGIALADKGCDFRLMHDDPGHRGFRRTPRYTRTAGQRFEERWGLCGEQQSNRLS